MISGLTIKRIKTEIQIILADSEFVASAWGFGSFFRSSKYNDIDVLVVVECDRNVLLNVSNAIRSAFSDLEASVGVSLDLLILTSREFMERPLIEMDRIVLLYSNTVSSPKEI
jgi:predicted nucleotidyltransferase